MKKLFFALALLCATAVHAQQYMRLWQNAESTRCLQKDITFSNAGKTVSIDGKQYATSQLDSITIVKTIFVTWNGAAAQVVIPESAQSDVTATTDGGHVTITNNNVMQEMELVLAGNSTDGSLTYNGQYKCKFHLNGLNLTSTRGAALDIQCGKRIDLILTPGTNNVLTDAVGGQQKAALYCKGHMEIGGAGNLTIAGRGKHALSTKEYLYLKGSCGTITIAESASDGLHIGQYFMMNGGTVIVDGKTKGDCIQVDATEDATDELNGQAIIKGGTLTLTAANMDCKALKTGAAENESTGAVLVPAGDITISGGTLNLTASGNGSRAIQTDANLYVSAADNALACNITASGAKCTCGDSHKCYGIKIGKTITVDGVIVNVKYKSTAKDYKCDGNGGLVISKNGGKISSQTF